LLIDYYLLNMQSAPLSKLDIQFLKTVWEYLSITLSLALHQAYKY